MPTAQNEPVYQRVGFQSAASRPFTLTSEIDATRPRFRTTEGDMWESLNGRNQPLIRVAPAIVHGSKLQHGEVRERQRVFTVGGF